MKIGILSRNANLYSTKRLKEAAIARGCEAVVIDHLQCSLVTDIGSGKVLYKGKDLNDIDCIIVIYC
jgi:ribosomal protein S6--L-glutamate ligase